MGNANLFTIYLDDASFTVCRSAFKHHVETDVRYPNVARTFLSGRPTWGMALTLQQGEYVQRALISYAENEVREGTAAHRQALDMAAVVEDHLVRMRHLEASPETLEKEAPPAYAEVARAANQEKARHDKLRDEMLREVFMGGPRKALNIWGDAIEEDAESFTHKDWRREAKTTSPEDWRKAGEADIAEAAERQREVVVKEFLTDGFLDPKYSEKVAFLQEQCEAWQASVPDPITAEITEWLLSEEGMNAIKEKLSTVFEREVLRQPIARAMAPSENLGTALRYQSSVRIPLWDSEDDAAHVTLTQGSTMSYNQDMQVEGAAELLKEQANQTSAPIRISDGVVGTVSAFLQKARR